MADDSMEITSEHMQAGEDIDIDIDFSAGQADEDDILQDAQSNADYGNEFSLQQSPMHQDDPMIDDDSTSYQMEDADFIPDDALQNTELEPMSFASGDIPLGSAVTAVTHSEEHDIKLYEEDQLTSDVADRESISIPQDESQGHIAADAAEGSSEQIDYSSTSQALDNRGGNFANEDLQPAHDLDPPYHSPAVAQEESTNSVAVSKPSPTSPPHEVHALVTSPRRQSPVGSPSMQESSSANLTLDALTDRKVKVIYQSIEYALFAASDSDDPDSFFLRDVTVMGKPLDQFFQAIREIILDDLSPEDELCLNIDDLGLEIEEGASTLQNVTLTQILSLHEKLWHNDGVDTPQPLYLLLGTRISFSRRFDILAEGALQGKGMSEFVLRDENSEVIEDAAGQDNAGVESSFDRKLSENIEDEFTRDAEALQLNRSPVTNHQIDVAEIYEEGHQQVEDYEDLESGLVMKAAETEIDFEVHHKEQHIVPQEECAKSYDLGDETGLQSQIPDAKDHNHESGPDADHSLFLNASQRSPQYSATAKGPSGSVKVIVSSGDREEGEDEEDLIDYSDEETQFPVEPVGIRAAIAADADTTNTEDQANDTELQRHPISRQADEKLLEQSIDQSNEDIDGDEEYVEDTEIGYEEHENDHPREFQSGGSQVAGHSADTLGGREDSLVDYSNDPETFEGDEEAYALDVEVGTEDGYDVSDEYLRDQNLYEKAELLGIPQDTEQVETDAPSIDYINTMDVGLERLAPSTSSSLGAVETAETAESSITLGAEEIQYDDDDDDELGEETSAQHAAVPSATDPLQKDEIDYEDDEDDEDEENPISIRSGAVTVTEVLSNSNGKRPIAEVESVTSTPVKDAKRPRS